MTEHYSKQTVSVSEFCRKCNKHTEHSVYDGRKGACLVCLKKQTEDAARHDRERRKVAQQGLLFREVI